MMSHVYTPLIKVHVNHHIQNLNTYVPHFSPICQCPVTTNKTLAKFEYVPHFLSIFQCTLTTNKNIDKNLYSVYSTFGYDGW